MNIQEIRSFNFECIALFKLIVFFLPAEGGQSSRVNEEDVNELNRQIKALTASVHKEMLMQKEHSAVSSRPNKCNVVVAVFKISRRISGPFLVTCLLQLHSLNVPFTPPPLPRHHMLSILSAKHSVKSIRETCIMAIKWKSGMVHSSFTLFSK